MGHVKKIEVDGETIFEIDYSDCNQEQMIALINTAREIALSENRSYLVLSCFNTKNYITPAFLRHAEKATAEILHLIHKQALIGLSPTQKIILQGYNILFQRNFRAFDSREEALRFLLDKKATDDDLPEYFKK